MNLIKPKKLKKGDTIGLLSISGDIREPERIEKAKNYFEKKGFKVVVSDTTYKKYRYMAGKDEDRLNELHSFFSDKDIDAIVCTRGGYGVIRLIDKIDYELIRNNPKILVGYSDITALLTMIYKKTGMLTFHGAMANGDFGEDEVSEYTERNFFEAIETLKEHSKLKSGSVSKVYSGGNAEGILWGGNLATLSSLAGQDFVPGEKFILFLEDINEPVYKIDRMMTQLLNLPEFKKNIAGIVLGQFTDVDNEGYLEDFFRELAEALKVPISSGFLISHEKDKLTIPIGCNVKFDADSSIIEILDDVFISEE